MMQPTLRAARRFTRLAVWAPREFIASSPGAFDTLITKHSRHIFRVFLHLRAFFLSILAPTVFGVRFADRIRRLPCLYRHRPVSEAGPTSGLKIPKIS